MGLPLGHRPKIDLPRQSIFDGYLDLTTARGCSTGGSVKPHGGVWTRSLKLPRRSHKHRHSILDR
jgi:hypothetical protein